MAGISIIGSYSGIDQSTIDQLMQVEKLPLNQLTTKKTDITAKQNAWKDVNTRLNSLFEKLKALQSPDTFSTMTSKVSTDSKVNVAASKDAIAGSYKIQVAQLATSSTITSNKILAAYDIDGKFKDLDTSGSFAIKNGDGVISDNIVIGKGDTLKTVANKINEKSNDRIVDGKTVVGSGTGVTATIIDGHLVLSDEKTGKRNIEFTNVSGSVLDDLELTGKVVEEGKQSIFSINGITATRDSNTVSDAVLGLTINLSKAHSGTFVGDEFISSEYDTVSVAIDTEKLTKAVKDFVDQYNSTMSFIEGQLAAGTVTDEGTTGRGILAGDSSLRSLQATLRTMVTDSLGGNDGTSIKDISALGVKTTDKSGVLSLNSSKLLEEFAKDPQNVINFFSYEPKDAEGNYIKDEKGNNSNVGFISKLNSKINTYISSSDGLIKSKNESFDRTLKDLNKQIERFNDRMIRKEEYYKKMFSALDVAMMQAESQMEWLNGQISAMNGQSSKK